MKKVNKKTAEKRALKAMSDYVRERDKFTCFTCDLVGNKYNMQAGHLFKRSHKEIKFSEWNVNTQCIRCNHFLGGNEREYTARFIKRFGIEKYNELDARKNIIGKYNTEYFLNIEKYYKEKLKELNDNEN